MSREFAHFMESISGDSNEQRINELMEILEKVMMIISNSVDSLSGRLFNLDQGVQLMMQRVVGLEQRPIPPPPGTYPAGAPGVPAPVTPVAPPPPKPEPKPMSPMSARAALQSELKELFNKRKQQ